MSEINAPDLELLTSTANTVSLLPKTGKYAVLGDIHPSNRAFFMLTDSLSPSLVVPTTVDGIFHLRVCEMIRAYGKYVDDITVRYFQGVHRWLPIVSRSRFHDRLVVFQSPPVVDFSVLLLSMCLITHYPVCTISSDYYLNKTPSGSQGMVWGLDSIVARLKTCLIRFDFVCKGNADPKILIGAGDEKLRQ